MKIVLFLLLVCANCFLCVSTHGDTLIFYEGQGAERVVEIFEEDWQTIARDKSPYKLIPRSFSIHASNLAYKGPSRLVLERPPRHSN